MLPFGLMTDVSAGALTAGAGGLQSAGQAAAGAGGKGGFAKELSAFAEEVAGKSEGSTGSLPIDVSAALAGEVLPEARNEVAGSELFGEVLPDDSGEALLQLEGAALKDDQDWMQDFPGPVMQEPVKPAQDAAVPALPVQETPIESAAVQGLSGDDLLGQDADGEALSQARAQSTVDGSPRPALPGNGLAAGEAELPGAVKASAQPKVEAVQGQSMPQPVADGAAGKGEVSLLPNKADGVGSEVSGQEKPSVAGGPLPQDTDLLPNTADKDAVTAVRSGLSEDNQDKPSTSRPVADTPVATIERRWQSELPQELRAPVVRAAQNVDAVAEAAKAAPAGPQTSFENFAGVQQAKADAVEGAPSGQPEGVVADAEGGEAISQTRQVPNALSENLSADKTVPVASQVQPKTVKDRQETPQGAVSAAGRAQATQAGSIADGAQAAAPLSPTPEQLPAEDGIPLSADAGDAEVAAKQVADKGQGPVSGNKAESPAGQERSVQAPAQAADKPVAGQSQVPGALLATQMLADDADLTLTEFSFTGEAGASVRGGDLTGAMRTESLQMPSQAQSGQVATQVAAEIARNLKNGQTRFQMRFDPPELGRVEVNMKVGADGSVQAHLIVERPETLDMFLRDQRGLERALEAAGLNADSDNLQFSLKQDGGREFASGENGADQFTGEAHGEAGSDLAEVDAAVEEVVRMTLAEQRGGLDVKI